MRVGRSFALIGVVGILGAGCGSAGPTMSGSELLARVRAAYRHVPAVQIVASDSPQQQMSWTDVLRHGVLTAEHFVARYPHHTPSLVFAYPDGRAYNFHPKTKCWVVNPNYWPSPSYRGLPFPNDTVIQGESPRRVGSLWHLPVVSQVGPNDTLVIDAKTFLIKSRVFPDGGVEHYRTMTRAPVFPTRRPLCPT